MRFPCSLLALLLLTAVASAADTLPVGVAKVDITPTYPIRLSGFGGRRAESEGVTHRIWVKALAFGDTDPAVLLTADAIGIPAHVTQEIGKRLEAKGVKPERLAITATHSHTAPQFDRCMGTLFGVPIPPEHQEHIVRYTREFTDRLEQAALAALADRKPATLGWAVGNHGLAKNRRTAGGPVDHELPVLVVRAPDGKVRAVYFSYACHCVTLSHNKVGGDWAGFAQIAVEDAFPGAVALASVGFGADSNPTSGVTGDKEEIAQRQGMDLAAEVKRVASGPLTPVRGPVVATRTNLVLPMANVPTRDQWQERAKRNDATGFHAKTQLARLDRGETLSTKVDYPVSSWSFGDDLGMVFLPGEVVVDYSHRLKKELNRSKLWLNGYSNDIPGYIPSERILKEGGYEGGGALIYFDMVGLYQSGLEDKIVAAVRGQLGKRFPPPVDTNKTGGTQPLSPERSRGALATGKGLAVDLVAAEPQVTSPVAISFGPDGRLWVAEMYDYPSGLDGKFGPGGRVRVLEDTDGDGKYDKATIFLDKIPFPTGVTAWRGGVLVCAAPDILYAEDTKRDGKADVVKKLYSGFGTDNYQARVNSLEYGLDGWVYGSSGLFGGQIKCHLTGKTFALGDRDFRIKPDTGEMEAATGRTQQGRVRDDWDNWFGCDNSDFCRHYILADHYLRRNPHLLPPAVASHVPADAEADRLYLARPDVQLFKLSGPSGRATAACGLGIYRDDLLGEAFRGNFFTCEPVNLVVHRLQPSPKDSTFIGRRPADEKQSEFLASTDTWFRPVQARTGPDGALYIVDMYRYVIEHPRWIPPEDVAKLDVRAGGDMGRIFRVRPADKPLRAVPRFDRLDAAGLVAALDSPNGTVRDLASQVLLWRNEVGSAPALEKLARECPRAETRLHALCLLDVLGKLTPAHVRRAVDDRHPGIRRHAFRLSEKFLNETPGLGEALIRRVDDTDAQVRLQVAYTLGLWNDPRAGFNMASLLLTHGTDPHLSAAVLSGVRAGNVRPLIVGVFGTDGGAAAPDGVVPKVVAVAAALGDKTVIADLVDRLTGPRLGAAQTTALAGLLDALARRGEKTIDPSLGRVLAEARRTAADETAAAADRLAALGLLGRSDDGRAADLAVLGRLLEPRVADALQRGALSAVARIPDEAAASVLLAGWRSHTPSVKAQILDLLLSRPAWQRRLVAALEKGDVPPGQIDATRRQRLLTHRDAEVRRRAEGVFAATNADRRKVIDAYADVATLQGDATRGRAVFVKSCASCHYLDNAGTHVGPDLAALANKTVPYLLQEIFDPSRNVDPRYTEYIAETKAGRTFTGLLSAETSTSLTLRGPDGKQQVLLRSEIDVLNGTGKSLMPEGLEKDVGKQDMADLIAFLSRQEAPPKPFAGNTPAVVRSSGGTYALRAADGFLYGGDIAFEPEFGNVGLWHGANDHVVWKVDIERGGAYDVWLDWACARRTAGNGYVVEVSRDTLRGKVGATGENWDVYRQEKVGTLTLAAGLQRLTFRPDGAPGGALIDLRGVHLVPPGTKPTFAAAPPPPANDPTDPKAVATVLLDDKMPQQRRQQLIEANPDKAAELVAALAEGLKGDMKEEYRRIPWIWRVAVAAGKRNETKQLLPLLKVSLPKDGEPLRDWQAVVLGGGVVNGISLTGPFPKPRLLALMKDDADLKKRWDRALAQASVMADDEKVPTGTRYDALRLIALDSWENRGPQLKKYLPKGTNPEMQQGAVSGLCDVEAAEATKALLESLEGLTAGNRGFAVEGLLRTAERTKALVEGLEAGTVKKEWLGDKGVKGLRELKDDSLRTRAEKVVGR